MLVMKKVEPMKTMMLLNLEEEARELSTHFNNLKIKTNLSIVKNMDEFVSSLSTENIECFILDWNYNHYPIVDLVEKIRKSAKYKKTPIVFVTDKKDARIPIQYSALNVEMVIPRPFSPADFGDSFTQLLEQKSSSVIPENYEVLILDNNKDILEIMVDYMDKLGHTRFQTCSSIAEAKKNIDKKDFDIFLLDWNLDDGTCIDLIDYVRSKKENKRLAESLIMVITGRNDVEDIMTLVQYNVCDHIIKPFDFNEFEDKIIYALDKHKKNLRKGA